MKLEIGLKGVYVGCIRLKGVYVGCIGLKGVYVGCIRLIKHISLNLLLKCQLQVYHLTNIYLDNI